MKILYCSFANIFGIVDADSLVWDDPLYPFMVYGIGVLVCMASCGLCGAVRGEILVSTATPPHVWQRFPKLVTENAATLGIIRTAPQQVLRANTAQRYRKERIVTFTVFPGQNLFSPVRPTILLGLSFITRAGYR